MLPRKSNATVSKRNEVQEVYVADDSSLLLVRFKSLGFKDRSADLLGTHETSSASRRVAAKLLDVQSKN